MQNNRVNFLLDQQVSAGLRGDFDRGWEIALELAKLAPDDPRPKFNRAWYEMRQGHLAKGFELLSYGRWVKAFGDQPLPTNKPIYRNEDLRGKSLLFCSEGGLGDEIINFRFTKNFADMGAKVIVTCDSSLKSVFARCPWVAAVVGHKAAPDVFHDFWVPGMSAGQVLGIEYKDLKGEPYLGLDPEFQQKWKRYFDSLPKDKRPRVGLRFYGNPKFEHEQHRKFPKELLINAVGDVPWINLQKEETSLPLDTWEDTLGVISQLDLVITSCTSVAHAAAALGKETWVMVPILPYYIWALPGEKTPWYKNVRLFRQTKFGEWDDVFEKVKVEFEKWNLK